MSWDDWEPEPAEGTENEVRIDFDRVNAKTEMVILIEVGGVEAWIPRSQIGDMERTGGQFSTRGWLTIPERLAVKKNLV